MTQLTALQSASTIHDIAILLDFKPSALAYLLYKKEDKYSKFSIPKKSSGVRLISAPKESLKLVQRRLSNILQNCLEEINVFNNWHDDAVHGFKRNRSIITNAKQHIHRRFVLNIDIKDFFGSINFGRVRGFFIKDKNFGLKPAIATILAQIICYENSLPQGSPCSPVISNLIGRILDLHLIKLSIKYGLTYSRYADDLTFSTNKKILPISLVKKNELNTNDWIVGPALEKVIERCGFKINPLKTRVQYADSRQVVTGLVVNKKINVPSDYRRLARAMAHHLFTKGYFNFVERKLDEKGNLIENKTIGNINQLHGMLGFINSIDSYNLNTVEDESKENKKIIQSKNSTYVKFLLYKEFYAAKMPLIIFEGQTDSIYILHAIRQLAVAYPELAVIKNNGEIKLLIKLYKYSESLSKNPLGITGGSSCLAEPMLEYQRHIKKFSNLNHQQPVIFVIDNDSGAGKVLSVVKTITKKNASRTEAFINVFSNLYLLTTPINPMLDVTQSEIEDFFADDALNTVVEGKIFNRKNDFDSSQFYGKKVFAHKVVKENAAQINFEGFRPLLDNLVLAIRHARNVTAIVE